MNEYTVIIAVVPAGTHEPRLVLKRVTTTSAPGAIAEATAAIAREHDDGAPRIGDAIVFGGTVEIASRRRRASSALPRVASVAPLLRARRSLAASLRDRATVFDGDAGRRAAGSWER